MSKNFAVLRKAGSEPSRATQPHVEPAAPRREYAELIRLLFESPRAVAIVGIGSDKGVAGVCEGLAKELALSGKRVVIVPVERLLRMNPITIPDETALMTGIAQNVWLWPSPLGRPIGFFHSCESKPAGANNWLDALRRNFDAVLLDCPVLDTTFGVTEVAAMADGAVLVVEAGRTSTEQILRDQRALQLGGATLAGCILLRRR
ncbi:MAG: protein tyrosine kinase [Bryobacterales bacterium]|nr:protein tyrosine kinase [Bryobacterales bacterium]